MPRAAGSRYTNNIPRFSGSDRTNIKPCAWRLGLSASQTWKVYFTFLPSAISTVPDGNAARSSSGAICARSGGIAHSSTAPASAAQARRRSVSRRGARGRVRGFDVMAVIVPEFHAACKIEARHEDALAGRQAGRRTQAEAAADDAIHGAARAEDFHAL